MYLVLYPRLSGFLSLYKLCSSDLAGVSIRLTWISVSLATSKRLLPQSPRVSFIVLSHSIDTMDYDAYDALLHHIFKQVSSIYLSCIRRMSLTRCTDPG